MNKYFTILFSAGAMLFVVMMAGFGGSDLKNSGGAPAGYTNSPGDGQNCSHCMGGAAVPVTGWITSNIPASGYLPGSTYTLSVTASGSGDKGFQVSPQDAAGNLLGTLTPGTGNKLVGSGKYVTHNAAQSGDSFTWNFQWTAPAAGAGAITFYASFVVGKLNTKTTTLTVSQSTVGISEQKQPEISVFPNPAHQRVTIAFPVYETGTVTIDLISPKGETVLNLMNESLQAGEFNRTFSVDQPSGVYLLQITNGEKTQIKKISIR
jgi:hypothetical protein